MGAAIECEDVDILKKAKDLHEHLRNYGSLGGDEKPLVVSAILLALWEQEESGFCLESLNGDSNPTDGEKLFAQLTKNLEKAKLSLETKREKVLSQFAFIKDRSKLNEKREDLDGKTPP